MFLLVKMEDSPESSQTIRFPVDGQSFTSVPNLHYYTAAPSQKSHDKDEIIAELYSRSVRLYVKYSRRSSFHKFLNVVLSTLIIVFGTLIFTISIYDIGSDQSSYTPVVAFSGMFVTIFQSLKSVFRFQDRAVMYNNCYLKSMSISRAALDLYSRTDGEVISQKITKYHNRLDEIESQAYDNSVVNFETSKTQSRKIISNIYSDDSNLRRMTLVSSV